MKALIVLPFISSLSLLLFFHLLPSSVCQKEIQQEWNYREGADKVNIHGIKSITRMLEKWGNTIFWQMKYTLLSQPNTLLPELSSLRPISEAIDNLVKQVRSMKKRLAELNECLNVINRALFPRRYKAQRQSRVQLRRPALLMRKRMSAQRHIQSN